MRQPPTLTTPRLILRPICIEDAPRIQQLQPHYEIVKHMTSAIPWPFPEDGALTYLRDTLLPSMEKGEEMAWALTLKAAGDDLLIGSIGLHELTSNRPVRGFWLGLPWHRQGLMTEAAKAVTSYALAPEPDGLGLPALYIHNAVDNTGSHRIKERMGGELLGYEERDYVAGRLKAALWKISAQNWRPD